MFYVLLSITYIITLWKTCFHNDKVTSQLLRIASNGSLQSIFLDVRILKFSGGGDVLQKKLRINSRRLSFTGKSEPLTFFLTSIRMLSRSYHHPFSSPYPSQPETFFRSLSMRVDSCTPRRYYEGAREQVSQLRKGKTRRGRRRRGAEETRRGGAGRRGREGG